MPNTFLNPPVPKIEDQSLQCSFILDALPALVFYIDNELCFKYINTSFEVWSGLPKDQVIGKGMCDILETESMSRLKDFADKALTGIVIDFETELLAKNGTLQYMEGSFKPDLSEAGEAKGFVGFMKECTPKDINNFEPINYQLDTIDSSHDKLLQALKESEERFNKIADSAPVMIWMSGPDKLCNFFNKGWLDFTGRTLEQEIGEGWAESIHPDDFELCVDTYATAFEKKEDFKIQYRLKRNDGVYRWIQDNGKPRFSPDGTFIGFLGFCIDVSDNKLMAEALEKEVESRTLELKKANQQLLRYNEELEQFAYAASHDLQEPLRKIQTFAGMLVERNYDELNDAGKNYLSKIIKSTERMSGIINDLLAYSRQSRVDEMFKETDLNMVLNNVLSDLELMIQQKGARITWDSLPNIKAIPSQINRLFYNLINNSLKFSNPNTTPKIHISVKHIGPDENGTQPPFIEFIVKDNGIGFEQKYADRIFQLFQRLNDKHSYNGNGIGLALCKKIVQNHFGEISAEGLPNEGAIFYLKFPMNIVVDNKAVVA